MFQSNKRKHVLISLLFSLVFAVSLFGIVKVSMNKGFVDTTAYMELSFVLGLCAVMSFSELFCIVTGFGKAKLAALSITLSALLTALSTVLKTYTSIALNESNLNEIFGSLMKETAILYAVVLAATFVLSFAVIHRKALRGKSA